jgi:WD40 repeat protein
MQVTIKSVELNRNNRMTATGKKKLALPAVYKFALSLRGDRLAAIGRNVVMTDPSNMVRLYSCHPISHPSYAAFSPDGVTLAVKSTSGRILLLAVESGEIILDFMNKTDGEGPAVAFSACGRYLVDASWNGQIIVRDTLRQLPDLRHTFAGEMIVGVLPSSNRSTWVFVHQPKSTSRTEPSDPAYITVWKWPLTEYCKLTLEIRIDLAELSPDGNILALADDEQVQFLLIENDTILKSAAAERCKRIRWSPDGTLVALVLQSSIRVHDFPSLDVVDVFEQEFTSDICFALDNSFVAVGGWSAGVVQRFKGRPANAESAASLVRCKP